MTGSDVRIASIVVADRYRRDLGDLTDLAASIKELGLLQPVVLDKNLRLIAGERRLEACKQLGWTLIPATIVNGLDDALKALTAERDENTCRKELTPSELVAMGRAIEEIHAPIAAASEAEGRRRGGLARHGIQQADHMDEQQKPTPQTRTVVAAALGVGETTYQRAKNVVTAATDETDPAHAVAKEQVAQMDSGQTSIAAAHEKVRTARRHAARSTVLGGADKSKVAVQARRDKIKALAARGYNLDQIAAEVGLAPETVSHLCRDHGITLPNMPKGSRTIDVNRVVESTATDLGLAAESALSLLAGKYGDLDASRLEGWVDSLSGSIRSLTTLKNNLKKELTRD